MAFGKHTHVFTMTEGRLYDPCGVTKARGTMNIAMHSKLNFEV